MSHKASLPDLKPCRVTIRLPRYQCPELYDDLTSSEVISKRALGLLIAGYTAMKIRAGDPELHHAPLSHSATEDKPTDVELLMRQSVLSSDEDGLPQ